MHIQQNNTQKKKEKIQLKYLMDNNILNSRKQQYFQIRSHEIDYQGKIEIINEDIKLTITQGLSQLRWFGIFSLEQLYKMNAVFMICKSIEKSLEYLKELFNDNHLEIKKDGSKVILIFSQIQQNFQVKFEIVLLQEQTNSLEQINSINNSLQELQKKNEQLEEVINSQKNQIVELENKVQSIQEEYLNQIKINQEEYFNQISDLKKYISLQIKEEKFSEILFKRDLQTIGQWIQNISDLKLIYRATDDGFKINQFFEKCKDISPTLVVIKTTTKKRFGGFTDLSWSNQFFNNGCHGFIQSNHNKSFIFSLDFNQKYSSNEKYCEKAIFCTQYSFGFGNNDINVQEDSNFSQRSSTIYQSTKTSHKSSYGRDENLNYHLSGQQMFQTKEIEVFQVIYN